MYRRTDLPKINEARPEVIESWYFPVMAYNGTKPVNSPLYKSNGKKNTSAYQEEVFSHIEEHSFLDGTTLGQYPFKTADFEYDPGSGKNNSPSTVRIVSKWIVWDLWTASLY